MYTYNYALSPDIIQYAGEYDFLAQNRDFSHEIPNKISRLPSLGAIFLSAPP
jgi:hypothetical protein